MKTKKVNRVLSGLTIITVLLFTGILSAQAKAFPESKHGYINGTMDTQNYTVAGAKSIKVTFDVKGEVENKFDKLFITNKFGKNIPGSPFTGKSFAGKTFTIQGDTVIIKLLADKATNKWGYKVSSIVDAAKKDIAKTEEKVEVKVVKKIIKFPESKHNYDNNKIDEQTFNKKGAASLKLTFDARTLVQLNFDKIFITDSKGKAVAGSPFTGNVLAGKTITVPGDTVHIKLQANVYQNFWGYKVTNIVALDSKGKVLKDKVAGGKNFILNLGGQLGMNFASAGEEGDGSGFSPDISGRVEVLFVKIPGLAAMFNPGYMQSRFPVKEGTIRADYFKVSLYAAYRYPVKIKDIGFLKNFALIPYVFAGPYGNFNISSNFESNAGKLYTFSDKVNGSNFGLAFGIGAEFRVWKVSAFMDMAYSYGLTTALKATDSDQLSIKDASVSGIQIYAGAKIRYMNF